MNPAVWGRQPEAKAFSLPRLRYKARFTWNQLDLRELAMLKRGFSTIGLSLVLVGLVGAAEGVDELVKQLKNKDEIVRFKAAKALGKLGAEAKGAIPALTEALKDMDEDVRAVAKR